MQAGDTVLVLVSCSSWSSTLEGPDTLNIVRR